MIVRAELPRDREAVAAVHAAAFATEDGSKPVEVGLVERLRADGDVLAGLTLVVEDDGAVVGHVVCSRGFVEDRPTVALGPIGVLPAKQRQDVGTTLMAAVLAAANAFDEQAVFLLGDPGYYGRFGFVLASAVGVRPPVAEWVEHFQVRRLDAWDGSLHGTFRYPDAFEGV